MEYTEYTEYFVTHKQALQLKELGFNKHCFAWFCNDMNILYSNMYAGNTIEDGSAFATLFKQISCFAPLKSQVFNWVREKYHIDSFCRQTEKNGKSYWSIKKIETDDAIKGYSGFCNTYAEAEITCIDTLIEIIKKC